MPHIVSFLNNGPKISATNFWNTSYSAHGAFYLSLNAGAFRLLIPDSQILALLEFHISSTIIISFGPWPASSSSEAMEILFDDNSDSPYAIHITSSQFDRIPPASDSGKEFLFLAYSDNGGKPKEVIHQPCFFRRVNKIPCLKPWK